MTRRSQTMQLVLFLGTAACFATGCAHNDHPAAANSGVSGSNASAASASNAWPDGGAYAPSEQGRTDMSRTTPSSASAQTVNSPSGSQSAPTADSSSSPSSSTASGDASSASPSDASTLHPGAGTAQDPPANSGASASAPEAALARLQASNRGELAIGRLAKQRGGSEVARYASRLVRHREASEAKVESTAKSLGVTLASTTDAAARWEAREDKETLHALRRLHGAKFDRRFGQHMREDRQRAVDSIQSMRASCSAPELCTLLDEVLPDVQSELAQARSLPGGKESATNP